MIGEEVRRGGKGNQRKYEERKEKEDSIENQRTGNDKRRSKQEERREDKERGEEMNREEERGNMEEEVKKRGDPVILTRSGFDTSVTLVSGFYLTDRAVAPAAQTSRQSHRD